MGDPVSGALWLNLIQIPYEFSDGKTSTCHHHYKLVSMEAIFNILILQYYKLIAILRRQYHIASQNIIVISFVSRFNYVIF